MEGWICFNDEYPKDNFGVLIKITDYTEVYENVRDKIYYGYAHSSNPGVLKCRIYVIFETTEKTAMSWKVFKDYDDKDIFWYNFDELNMKRDELL